MKLATKKLILKIGFSLMLLFFLSCTNEELEKPTTTSVVKQLESNLKLEQFTNKNLEVNWEKLQKTKKDSTEVYEIPVTEKIKSEMLSKLLQKEVKYELIAVKSKEKVYSYLIEAFSNLNYETFPSNIQNLNKFAGTLNVYELNGTKIGQLVVIEGKVLNPQKINTLEPLETVINAFYKSNNLTRRVPACGEVISLYETVETWSHKFVITSSAATGKILDIRDLGEKKISSTSTLFSYIYICGSSGQQEPLSATIHQIKTIEYERNIIDDFDPCSKVKNLVSDQKHKDALAELKKNFGLHYESGYYISRSKGYEVGTPKNNNELTGPTYFDTYGIIHVHPNDYPILSVDGVTNIGTVKPIHIFSPADINTFCSLLIAASKSQSRLDEVFVEMTSSTGTYQLRFDGDINNVKNFDYKGLDDTYLNHMNLYSEDLESGILTFIKENIGIDGIMLYKINENGTSEIKTFSPEKGLETNPC